MENSTETTTTESKILEILTQSGYDEKLVRKALSMTESRDIDEVLNIVIDIESNKDKVHVKKVEPKHREYANDAVRVLEENRKKILADKAYREELIRRYKAEKEAKIREEKMLETQTVTTVKADSKNYECMYNVRFQDSKSIKLHFMKDDTVEDLFKAIEEEYGSSNFTLYKLGKSEPIIRSNRKLSTYTEIFPRAALYVE